MPAPGAFAPLAGAALAAGAVLAVLFLGITERYGGAVGGEYWIPVVVCASVGLGWLATSPGAVLGTLSPSGGPAPFAATFTALTIALATALLSIGIVWLGALVGS